MNTIQLNVCMTGSMDGRQRVETSLLTHPNNLIRSTARQPKRIGRNSMDETVGCVCM